MVKSRYLIGIIALFLSAYALTSAFSIPAEGFQVLRVEGPIAALNYFKAQQQKQSDPGVQFGMAWAKFEAGDLVGAELGCNALLAKRSLPEKMAANSAFLLAYLEARTGRYDESMQHFHYALDIYENIGHHGNIFRSYLGLAEVAMYLNDMDGALYNLDQAWIVNEIAAKPLGQYYHLRAKHAFLEKDFDLALHFSKKRYEAHREDNYRNGMANALSDIGFYLILTGHPDQAFDKTMEAQELLNKTGDEDTHYYNLINFILLRRCEGRSVNSMVESVQIWIQKVNDMNLKNYLEFAMDFECEVIQELSEPYPVGDGNPSPPDIIQFPSAVRAANQIQ